MLQTLINPLTAKAWPMTAYYWANRRVRCVGRNGQEPVPRGLVRVELLTDKERHGQRKA